MITAPENVYTLFMDKVEKDVDFFAYFDMSEQSAMQIARERARSYLLEACSYLRRHVTLDFNLAMVTTVSSDSFAEGITDDEAYLLADIMLLFYYERELARLLPKLNTFNATELKLLHSPANERRSYMALIENQRARVNYLIADYYSKDRLTGKEKMVDNTLPEETEE